MDVKPIAEDLADIVAHGATSFQQRPEGFQVVVPEGRL